MLLSTNSSSCEAVNKTILTTLLEMKHYNNKKNKKKKKKSEYTSAFVTVFQQYTTVLI